MGLHLRAGRLGTYDLTAIGGEQVNAFIPPPLPPLPPLDLGKLFVLFEEASTALGRLDSMATVLPDTSLFLYMYVRKEALLSSQIEGIQSSLSDLLLFENDESSGGPLDNGTTKSIENLSPVARTGCPGPMRPASPLTRMSISLIW